ncbi:MAG TPA: LysR family transcriptional regulator [Burkholderiaceae bacterium]|nr:LysR family transcriptional regulator [Burkholderiaceae bacterium]
MIEPPSAIPASRRAARGFAALAFNQRALPETRGCTLGARLAQEKLKVFGVSNRNPDARAGPGLDSPAPAHQAPFMVLRALQAFLAVHRRGTIAAAAEDVHLSPAAVSAQLKLLEERLNVELFVRTKRSLTLSSAGHRLIPLAEKMVSVYEEMVQLSAPGAVEGKISLGVINSALTGIFPAVLRKLKAESPRLEIKLVAGISPDLMAQVEAGLLDAAVLTQPPKYVAHNLQVHHLYTEPVALVLPRGMKCDSVAAAMAASPYIAFDRSTWVGQDIDAYLLKNDIHVRPAMELNSQDAVLAIVKYGLGVSILPMLRGTAHANDPDLQVVAIPGLQRGVSLVEQKANPRGHLTARLLAVIVEVAGAEEEAGGAVG